MSGDYTRFSFKPRKRYSGVLMQQGRVQLDSDWNEEIDIARERLRLLSLDSFGPLGVPHLTTPNAFRLGLTSGPTPDISIGPGRLYIDGLLAESFPEDKATYTSQPFYPAPPKLGSGDWLAYLDIWEREVTYIEDPDLLDAALGGADTAARLQTVWQLKVQKADRARCGEKVGDPPSAGRLTTQAVAPPAADDPCILPPVVGYRGLENRLYRVEIHEGGPLGTARFKWSRDNGSIVSAVTALTVSGSGGETTLTVNRIGCDQVMRFKIDDWVTVTDDHRELMGEPGEMAKIVDLKEADRQIVLNRTLPTAGRRSFGANAAEIAERYTRIQRWDETAAQNRIDRDGLIKTGAGPIDLEAGIQVRFSTDPGGGSFRVGDHWVFWARTATAHIEVLNAAPPRGIEHHYVQLGAITGLGGQEPGIEDCRPAPQPPAQGEGVACCTITVSPGDDPHSIQKAIDKLSRTGTGGCVCLKAGVHRLAAPIMIRHDNITLHGESRGTVVHRGVGTLLIVAGAQETRVHTIVFRQDEAGAPDKVEPAIMLTQTKQLVIDDCRVETRDPRRTSIGLLAAASEGLRISACTFEGPLFGVCFGRFGTIRSLSVHPHCRDVTVAGCEFVGPGGDNLPSFAILGLALDGAFNAEDNVIETSFGIIVNNNLEGMPTSAVESSRITGNRIKLTRGPARQFPAYGIDIAADASIVRDNYIEHPGGHVTGIRLCGNGSIATGNIFRGQGGDNAGPAVAIWAGHAREERPDELLPLERLLIADNIFEGANLGVVLLGAARSRVSGNVLSGGLPSSLGVALDRCTDCQISANILERPSMGVLASGGARNAIDGNRIDGGQDGVLVASEEAPTIRGNRLTGLDQTGVTIKGVPRGRCSVIENRVVRCGAYGIIANSVDGELHVEANEVRDIGVSELGASSPVYGIVGDLIREARIESNLITYSELDSRKPGNEDRALLLSSALERRQASDPNFGFAALIANNTFRGPGASALVELFERRGEDNLIGRFERVLFHGNYCDHLTGPANERLATVSLVGRHCSIGGNHVKAATGEYRSYNLHEMPGPFIGNVSHFGYSWRSNEMPSPEKNFNTEA
jgi:hypothetical protein